MGNNIECVHHIVLVKDMNNGKLEYVKFGKVGLNNCASPLDSNIFQKAHQWPHFHKKNHLGATLPRTSLHMHKSGQLYQNLNRVIPFRSVGMDVQHEILQISRNGAWLLQRGQRDG